MKYRTGVALSVIALGVSMSIYAAQIAPVPANPMEAQTLLGFNIKSRCPDLRFADAGTRAVIVFWVPQRGSQSNISLKTSSGLDDLDSAALSCVSKLKFAPATTVGNGEAVDSWQQVAVSWADPGKTYEARAAMTQSAPVAARAPTPVNARQDEPGGQVNSVTVHVCVDDKGKLEQAPSIVKSSGFPTLDQAALKIATAGSAYYRPGTPTGSASPSGCAQLAIHFDTK